MINLRKMKGEILGKKHVPVQISEGSLVLGHFVWRLTFPDGPGAISGHWDPHYFLEMA